METRKLLQDHFDALKARKAKVEAALAPVIAQRDALRDKLAPLEGELRDMNQEIKRVTGEVGLFDLDNEIAALARALGAKSMAAEPAGAPE